MIANHPEAAWGIGPRRNRLDVRREPRLPPPGARRSRSASGLVCGRTHVVVPVLVGIIALSWARPLLAEDAKVEAAAEDAIAKAPTDYATKAFGKALYRLGKALRACGKEACATASVAALARDAGSVHVAQHDKKGALKLFARAIGLVDDLELNPAYDTPDVRAVWEEAGGRKKPEPPPPAPPTPPAPPPPAAFAHAPATEQAADTPLPVYVEGGPAGVARVVLEYGSAAASGAWKEVAFDRVGTGWGAVVPCGDVGVGAVRYYVDGFDSGGAKVATAGDAEHPYEVPVKQAIASEPAHLPGQPAPRSCAQAAPPLSEGTRAAEEPAPSVRPARHWRRWWVGVSGEIDFMNVPSGDDLCIRNAATGRPANGDNLYCTTLDGVDFPPASVTNGTLANIVPGQGQGGHSDGGLQLGDVRYLASVDYAVAANALVGARVGFIINRYQGTAAVSDKRAFGSPLHLELRATWVFGHDPLAGSGVAPIVFVAGGVSEFDAQLKSTVTITQGTPPTQTHQLIPVNIWKTDGPGFVGAGLGLRISIDGHFAIIPAIRGDLALGNGVTPLFGPELSLQLGF